MEQKQVLENYREADLFALACRITSDGDRDGLPNVLVEAASQALTCISTNISGIPEFFVNGENGLLTEPENPAAFAKRCAPPSPIRNCASVWALPPKPCKNGFRPPHQHRRVEGSV